MIKSLFLDLFCLIFTFFPLSSYADVPKKPILRIVSSQASVGIFHWMALVLSLCMNQRHRLLWKTKPKRLPSVTRLVTNLQTNETKTVMRKAVTTKWVTLGVGLPKMDPMLKMARIRLKAQRVTVQARTWKMIQSRLLQKRAESQVITQANYCHHNRSG